MQIKFNDPSCSVAFPCIAQIHSATYNEDQNTLELFGTFKGHPAVFEVRCSVGRAKNIINILAEGNTPNFCDMYSKFKESDIPNTLISIYKS